jgi:hypothetical protein
MGKLLPYASKPALTAVAIGKLLSPCVKASAYTVFYSVAVYIERPAFRQFHNTVLFCTVVENGDNVQRQMGENTG